MGERWTDEVIEQEDEGGGEGKGADEVLDRYGGGEGRGGVLEGRGGEAWGIQVKQRWEENDIMKV